MAKKIIFRIASIVIIIFGFWLVPPKSVAFDNLINASKTLLALALIPLAGYLWSFGNKSKTKDNQI